MAKLTKKEALRRIDEVAKGNIVVLNEEAAALMLAVEEEAFVTHSQRCNSKLKDPVVTAAVERIRRSSDQMDHLPANTQLECDGTTLKALLGDLKIVVDLLDSLEADCR